MGRRLHRAVMTIDALALIEEPPTAEDVAPALSRSHPYVPDEPHSAARDSPLAARIGD